MGVLIDGEWNADWDRADPSARPAVPRDTQFRDWITNDGSSDFPAEPGRYHLYIAMACPWAHRTYIYRKLKKLEDVISLSIVDPSMGEQGWTLSRGADPVNQATVLHEVYCRARAHYTGRVSVPALWDKHAGTIVNNESAEIIRMLNAVFDDCGDASVDFYPSDLRAEIDVLNETVHEHVNAGVYKAGFAGDQPSYEQAVGALFETLETLEGRLIHHRYLHGNRLTETDWRLFPTLVRFDAVYHGHFKCNVKRLLDYENLWAYTRDLYQTGGVSQTIDIEQIKRGYYVGMSHINPNRLVPVGPALDFSEPHRRDRLSPS